MPAAPACFPPGFLCILQLLSAAPCSASITPFVVSLVPCSTPLQPPLPLVSPRRASSRFLWCICRSAMHSCCPSLHLHHSRCCSARSFDQLHFQTMRLWPLSPGRRFHSQTRLTGRSFSWYSACFLLPLLLLKSPYIELTACAPGEVFIPLHFWLLQKSFDCRQPGQEEQGHRASQ